MEANKKNFSIEEAIKWGWEKTKKHFGFVVLVLIIYYLVSMLPSILQGRHGGGMFGGLLSLAVFVATMIMQMGIMKMILKFYDGGMPKLNEIIYTKNLFEYFLGSLLYSLIVLGGIILLIIPGIYWALRYQFAPLLIVDKGLKPVEALKKSAVMTEGIKWKLLLLCLVMCGINLLGMLVFMVGLLVTIPVTTLAYVYIYRKILAK
ncbi:DUF975 family protein [Patescibacteria group bacterium]|nr:DUF975 family protein [Patescibacteria group bacterium]MBU1613476.1 DUF975 family protein [Patescibacteria group bacterium]